jgi:diguanylate cyclase (GGDEF)-like protein/putative nucleotidyltransferase with HDIG domain
LILATVYFLLNSWLVAIVVGLHKKRSPVLVWRQSFLWLSLNYYSGASVAALILPYVAQAGDSAFVYVIGVILPVLIISYLTFKTALGRIEDANTHLSQLNRLYLSTIETLAMAIDAKDQITHGHIRRVQQYAVGLAKHLGISDRALISAIEAASLLHDMGKLAVPEYILNKPGKLTPAEFDRMKLHASIGADILSAIDFPYPVVPIVRHHHENWDGTGYPHGLKGTAIPIGARILSVVDCFDALTSDRPYRPRMSDSDAIRILLDRRGSMYDPLIVDTFIELHAAGAHSNMTSAPQATLDAVATEVHALRSPVRLPSAAEGAANARLEEIAASTEETMVLYDLATGLTGPMEVRDVADVIATHLRRIVPASVIVFFVYDTQSDHLVSLHAVGHHSSHLVGLRVPRGERLSGWVAANRQTIVNADPVLDLGEAARALRPRLRSCISTPLAAGKDLVGVLSLYSVDADAFNEEHKRILEIVGGQVSHTVRHALSFEQNRASELKDTESGLPNVRHLERMFAANTTSHPEDNVSVIFVTLRHGSRHGERLTEVSDREVEVVASGLRKGLRVGDLLFRYNGNELAILLSQTDAVTAGLVAERTRAALATHLSSIHRESWPISVYVGVATAPADGVSVNELVLAARSRENALNANVQPRSVH